MLRIELLPDYIHDKNKIRNLGIFWIVVAGVAVFALMAWNTNAGRQNDAAKADRRSKEDLKKTTDDHKASIASEQQARKDVEAKQKFVLNSMTYNDGWPEVFETIRDVRPADNSIILDSMSLDAAQHQVVSLTGFGKDEKAVVRWWMSLRNNTALFDHVNFDLVPRSFAPVSQASNSGGPGMGGPGGRMGGGYGNYSSGGPSMMGSSGGKFGGMPGGMMMPGMMGGGSGGMGMGMGGGRASASNGPGELAGVSGINFTASVVLKTALAGGISTPSWPAGGGGGATSGFGGFGGGMGGGKGGGMMPSAMGGMKPGGA